MKQKNIWISPTAADALLELAEILNVRNQRGEPSLSALVEWLGQTYIAMPKLADLLDATGYIASSGDGDWEELENILRK